MSTPYALVWSMFDFTFTFNLQRETFQGPAGDGHYLHLQMQFGEHGVVLGNELVKNQHSRTFIDGVLQCSISGCTPCFIKSDPILNCP